MTPAQLVIITVILSLVTYVFWTWLKYPSRPREEWAGHTCGECRFRATNVPHKGRCGEARALFAGRYRDLDHPACEVWQPMEESKADAREH